MAHARGQEGLRGAEEEGGGGAGLLPATSCSERVREGKGELLGYRMLSLISCLRACLPCLAVPCRGHGRCHVCARASYRQKWVGVFLKYMDVFFLFEFLFEYANTYPTTLLLLNTFCCCCCFGLSNDGVGLFANSAARRGLPPHGRRAQGWRDPGQAHGGRLLRDEIGETSIGFGLTLVRSSHSSVRMEVFEIRRQIRQHQF